MAELNNLSILIVEDEVLIAEDIKDICELAGYHISCICYRAGQAINALQKTNFDLAILDINLEDELSGIEIAQYISTHSKNTVIIFLTSYADKQTLQSAKDAMPMGYIVKPFNKEQLISTIEIALLQFSRFMLPRGLDNEAITKKFNIALTEREYEILTLIFEGKSNNQMGQRLFLSVNTIKYHIKHLYEKLNVNSRSQLMSILTK